jgi:hypothetical protein
MKLRLLVAWIVIFPDLCLPQSKSPIDRGTFLDRAWVRDTRPPVYRPPSATSAATLEQLQELHTQALALSRKAEFDGDYQAALAAAWEARAAVESIAMLTARAPARAADQTSTPIVPLAFKDGTARPVRAYWTSGGVLYLVTLEGKTEQISPDRVDWNLTQEWNAR